MRVAVAGCGDVGTRLARRLAARGDAVLALRRHPPAIESHHAIDWRPCDLTRLDAGALAAWQADTLVWLAAPAERTPAAYQALHIDGARRVLDALGGQLRQVLFVSSTAVYGQGQQGRVDEHTAAEPDRWNGELLLRAEQAMGSHAPGLCVLRPSGLYGPGREQLLRRARAGERGAARWTNRLHVDDCAAAIAHLLNLPQRAPLYCLSDSAPLAEDAALSLLRQLCAGQSPTLPDLARTDGCAGRWIDNRRLRDSGFALAYPDLLAGYAAVLADAPAIQAPPGLAV